MGLACGESVPLLMGRRTGAVDGVKPPTTAFSFTVQE
jgi:hypothetical protein